MKSNPTVSWSGCSNTRYPKGFEYKSKANIGGIPLLHISFRYLKKGKPVPAKGIIAIGQFAAGIISIGQFGIGVFSLSQLSISMFAVAQIAIAHYAIAQIAIAHSGMAQIGLFWGNLLVW